MAGKRIVIVETGAAAACCSGAQQLDWIAGRHRQTPAERERAQERYSVFRTEQQAMDIVALYQTCWSAKGSPARLHRQWQRNIPSHLSFVRSLFSLPSIPSSPWLIPRPHFVLFIFARALLYQCFHLYLTFSIGLFLRPGPYIFNPVMNGNNTDTNRW